ncbi:MAG: helix-turn-helix domain-containing protein [Sulfitobacter sp.]
MKFAKITQTTILVLDETNTLSFAAAVDPLRAANRQAGRKLFNWQFVTPGANDVLLTSGLAIPASPIERITECDLLLVVAGFELEAQTTPALRASLRRLAARSTLVAGIDGGPWVMAKAGLLDRHNATTHWEDMEDMAGTFPQVTVQNARYVVSANRMTSGGAVPAIEMMLHIVSTQHGASLAERIAGSFIYDGDTSSARPQTRSPQRLRHSPLTAKAHTMMEATLDDPRPIADIARDLGVSQRALQTQFQTRLGTTPKAHSLSLRLTEADRLVRQNTLPLHEIALATGFASQSSFARAYRAAFGRSAREARQGKGQ